MALGRCRVRVNVYSEELTEHVEVVERDAPCGRFMGIRFYMGEPGPTTPAVTLWARNADELANLLRGALVAVAERTRTGSSP
jgi:hypothetical protein